MEMVCLKNELELRIYEISKDIVNPNLYENEVKFAFILNYFSENIMQKYDTSKIEEEILKKNIKKIHKEAMSIITQTIVFHLDNLYIEEQKTSNFKQFYSNFKKEFTTKKEFRIEFFQLYNELFRILYDLYESQIKYLLEILNIIKSNKIDFFQKFSVDINKIQEIELLKGDRHLKGRSTTLIKIDNKSFFIKWKLDECENKVLEFTRYFYNIALDEETDQAINYIKGHEYYIQESIIQKESYDDKKLYNNFGKFLFIAYLLQITDLHEENIIVTNNTVVSIDCETIFNYVEEEDDNFFNLKNSVYFTSLLPNVSVAGAVLSGFNSNENQLLYVDEFKINIKSDGIELENLNPIKLKEKQNKAKGSISKNIYDFSDLILDGFKKAYIGYLKQKIDIDTYIINKFNNTNHRVLYKNTYDYSRALWHSYHPYLMTNGKARNEFFHEFKIFNKEEIEQLQNNTIPFFYKNIEINQDSFIKFSEKDLLIQSKLIEESLYLDKRRNYKNENLNKNNGFSINRLADRYDKFLNERKIIFKNESIWVDVVETGNSICKNTEICSMEETLYGGRSGLYLFFIEHLKKFPNEDKKKEVIKEIYDIEKKLELNIKKYPKIQNGFYDGVSGIIYLLYVADVQYKLFGSEKIIEILENVVNNVEFDINFDMLSGSAGLLSLLNLLYENEDCIEFKGKIKEWINIVVNHFLLHYKKYDDRCGWEFLNEKKEIYLGYAHGLAGILPQLYRSYKVNGDERIISVINECLKFIYSKYDYGKNTWPNKSESNIYSYNWCHGSPGIALGLTMLYEDGYEDEELLKYIRQGLKVIQKEKKESMCLCHGSYGNYLIGKYCSKIIKEPLLEEYFTEELLSILQYIYENLDFSINNKAFMSGLTGIMYWALKDNEYNQKIG